MNSHQNISARDIEATSILYARMKKALGDSLDQIMLFGSKARGDGDRHSDIDILVIAKDEDGPTRQKILRLGARVSLENDVLFNIFPISVARWNHMAEIGYPLYKSIIQDGIDISSPNMSWPQALPDQ